MNLENTPVNFGSCSMRSEVEVQGSKCTSDRGQSVHRNNGAMWICGFVDFGAKSSSGANLIKENQISFFYIFKCIWIVLWFSNGLIT